MSLKIENQKKKKIFEKIILIFISKIEDIFFFTLLILKMSLKIKN